MIEKEMTCIICPVGCHMIVKIENQKVVEVKGNSCNRGPKYASDECIAPKRILTTTICATIDGRSWMVPVKTTQAIPKELLFEAMAEINHVTLMEKRPIGSVVLKNILNTGVDVVLTGQM